MPSGFLRKFQGQGEMLYVPSVLYCLGPFMGGVLQLDQPRVCDGEVDANLTTWGLEEWHEHRVHLKFLRDSTMNRIVTINADLIDGIIGKMESNGWMCGRLADANKDFANDLIWIDTDRV
jgi:hypothetical protein